MVAEGVERPAQRAWLADVGCEFAQGYLFAPPGAPADVHGSASDDAPHAMPHAVRAPRETSREAVRGSTAPA